MKKISILLFISLFISLLSCSDKEDNIEVYTVSFHTDGGTPTPSGQRVKAGETAKAPTQNPTKAGYIFKFWQLEGTTSAYNFQTPVNRDISLYAQWQEESQAEYWQVSWELNGGAWSSEDNHATKVLKGGTLAEPVAPVKNKNTFEGWYKEAALTNQVNFPYDVSHITADFKLYAKWKGENEPEDGTYKYFTSISAMKSWLDSQPDSNPYKIGLKGINLDAGNNWDNLGFIIYEAKYKYVELDLQHCTGSIIPDGEMTITWVGPVKHIDYTGFMVDCSYLINIKLPSTLSVIGEYAFYHCNWLESVTLPEGLKEIRGYAFQDCRHMTSVKLPQSLEHIRREAFSDCWGLTSIDIPQTVTEIEYAAFMGCSSLHTITLHEGLKIIGDRCFSDCTLPEKITIPSTVTVIGNSVFRDCKSLTEIVLLPVVPPSYDYSLPSHTSFVIKVPKNSVDAYKTAEGWSTHADQIVGF